MLSDQYFYFQLTRKIVAIFGSIFNEITIVRKDDSGNELNRMKVPLIYAPKDRYITRLLSDPNLAKPIQTLLPRMSFEITGFGYDGQRKQNSLLRSAKGNTATRVASQYMGVPWDIDFNLYIYSRTTDDGLHIVEQILPYFNPDYTPTVNVVSEVGFLKDLPILLNGVSQNVEYEGDADAVRYITWTLSFTVKAYYYGPVTTPKIIRTVITNIYNDPSIKAGYIMKINTDNGNNGTYKIDDVVYQGNDYSTATAFAQVIRWNPTLGKLVLGGTQGQFTTNTAIKAVSSNASYNLSSFDASPLKLANITITPDPADAEPTDDFGFTTVIQEFPDTL